jgi:hypothetical protein
MVIFSPLLLKSQIDNQAFLFGATANYPDNPASFGGRYKLDFTKNEANFILTPNLGCSFFTSSATISTLNGEILFYTNGKRVVNSKDQIVLGTENLWPNAGADPAFGGGLVWVLPVSDSIFYILDEQPHYNVPNCLYCTDYFYHKIKVDLVTKKVSLIEKDHLFHQKEGDNIFQPIRHGNGRDWYIVIETSGAFPFKWADTKYEVWKLDKNGLSLFSTLNNQFEGMDGAALFSQKGMSPDGSKSFWFEERCCFKLFDFDRCAGQLSNEQHTDIYVQEGQRGGGAAFSPNNRFFYITLNWEIDPNTSSPSTGVLLQYDLQKPDYGQHPDTIAVADTLSNNPLTIPNYYPGQLFDKLFYGVDGRLYMKSGIDHYSFIEFPDSAGKACGFRSRALPTPKFAYTVPSVVNYRLGPLDGSPCDTLGINNDPKADFRFKKLDSLKVWFRDLSWHNPTAWSWDFGDGSPKVFEQFPTHNFPYFGKFNVCLTVSNQFGSDSFCREVELGIISATNDAISDNNRLIIFPNPANEKVEIILPTFTGEEKHQLNIVNQLGQILKTTQFRGGNHSISVEDLPAGMVFIQILENGKIKAVGKLVIAQ